MSEPTPQQIVDGLRAAGLTVVEMPGWRDRCRCHVGSHEQRIRPTGRGWQAPRGITWHITYGGDRRGEAAIDYTRRILIGGNGQTPGPLCLAGVDSDGRIIMVGAGRANHLGSISARAAAAINAGTWPTTGSTNWRGSGVDGNSFTYGFEAMSSTRPNAAQYEAMVTASAVLCRLLGVKPTAVHGHGEASDQRDFSDPNCDMGRARRDVAAKLAATTSSATTSSATTTKTDSTSTSKDIPMDQTAFNKLMLNALKNREVAIALGRAALGNTYGDRDGDKRPDTAGQIISINNEQLDRLEVKLDQLLGGK